MLAAKLSYYLRIDQVTISPRPAPARGRLGLDRHGLDVVCPCSENLLSAWRRHNTSIFMMLHNRLLQVLTIFIGVSSSTFTNPWGASRQSRAENGDRPVGPIPIGNGYSRCVPNAAVQEERDEARIKNRNLVADPFILLSY